MPVSTRPFGRTIWDDNFDCFSVYSYLEGAKNGYGINSNKKGSRLIGSTTRIDNYNGYRNGYGHYGENRKRIKQNNSYFRNDNYDDFNAYDYDYYSNHCIKEGHRLRGTQRTVLVLALVTTRTKKGPS